MPYRGLGAPEHEPIAVEPRLKVRVEPLPDVNGEKELDVDRRPEPERPHPGPPRVHREHLKRRALNGRHAPSLEAENVRGRERQGDRHEGLGLEVAVEVRRGRGVSVTSDGPGPGVLGVVGERDLGGIPRSQHVAAVDWLDREMRVGAGGGVGPRLQKL